MFGNPECEECDWKEPDGSRVFGWHAKALNSDAMVGGQIQWVGEGPERLVATVSASATVQIGILRDPAQAAKRVDFFMRNENSGYAYAMGALRQRVPLDRVGLDYLYATYVANGTLDDSLLSARSPHLLWAWNMSNEDPDHARVGRIVAA